MHRQIRLLFVIRPVTLIYPLIPHSEALPASVLFALCSSLSALFVATIPDTVKKAAKPKKLVRYLMTFTQNPVSVMVE